MLSITTEKFLHDLTLPLPIYRVEKLATAQSDQSGSFSVFVGLTREQSEQLRGYALDKTDLPLQKGTSDYKRFGVGSYEQWYGKSRIPFVLIHNESGSLASILWFGPKELPHVNAKKQILSGDEQWDTIAFRTYGEYRGVGITTAFGSYVLEQFHQVFPEHRIWLAADTDNEPGLKLYRKLGFRVYGELENESRYVMIFDRSAAGSN